MVLARGDKVIIVAGPNKGKTGDFIEYFALQSCRVRLDSDGEVHDFRKRSVKRAIVISPPRARRAPPPPNPEDHHEGPAEGFSESDADAAVRRLITKVRKLRLELLDVENDLADLMDGRRSAA